jgi:hypothetical protein
VRLLIAIGIDCITFRRLEVADFGGFVFLTEQSQKGRQGERRVWLLQGDVLSMRVAFRYIWLHLSA